ncbi:MAG: exodeoxyribonuclease VII small subunit [bacterium]|nr:exodeoxyribonuclease VII small subunit [bacterium]
MTKRKKEERFEEQLERLEAIVARLEDESVGLEQALELFEEGMTLARGCRTRLERIEQRIEQLLEPGEGQEAETAPLTVD